MKRILNFWQITVIITLFLIFGELGNLACGGDNPEEKSVTRNRLFGNLPSNILNFGMVAQTGEWIYYSNSSDGWGLYKIKTDGTQKTKLTDYPVRFVNVSDGWVYFSDFVFEEPSCLIKIKTDGSKQTIISKDPAWLVILYGEWIYYANGKIYL